MYEDYEGLLTHPNDLETIQEIRLFIENLHGITSVVDSDHILNILLELKGKLPEDKDKMLGLIDYFLDLPQEQQDIFRLGRRLGLMGERLRDLHNWSGGQGQADDGTVPGGPLESRRRLRPADDPGHSWLIVARGTKNIVKNA